MAPLSGRSESQYSSQAEDFFISPGADLIVKRLGSRPCLTCPHVSGIETVAPGLARGDSGATAVAIRSFRK